MEQDSRFSAQWLSIGIAIGITIMFSICPAFGQEITEEEFIQGMAALSRMTEQNPFLKDSLDVIWEPESLNKFFTDKIYEKLTGNAYFGYTWDEGFTCSSREVSIEEIKDFTKTYEAAYRLSLEQALAAGGYKINPKAVCQIGLAIVGAEPKETDKTLPGVLIEAFLRNSTARRSFFIRFGTGSYEGFAVALRTSAARIYAELEARYNGEN